MDTFKFCWWYITSAMWRKPDYCIVLGEKGEVGIELPGNVVLYMEDNCTMFVGYPMEGTW